MWRPEEKDDDKAQRKTDYIMINKTLGVSLIIHCSCLLLLSPSFFLSIIICSLSFPSFQVLFTHLSLLSCLLFTFPHSLSFVLPSLLFHYLPPTLLPSPHSPSSPPCSLSAFHLPFILFHFFFFPSFLPSLSFFPSCPLLSVLLSHSLFFPSQDPPYLPLLLCHSSPSPYLPSNMFASFHSFPCYPPCFPPSVHPCLYPSSFPPWFLSSLEGKPASRQDDVS